MEQQILSYYLKIFSLFLFLVPGITSLHAQNSNPNKDEKKTEAVYFPLYNGLTVSADIYGLGASVLGSDFLSTEIGIEANLKNRFFPVVEIGYGTTDTTNEDGIHYKSSAPFFRVGMNYNTMYKKGNPNYLYVGFRVAYSSFSYDLHNIPIDDPIYGESQEGSTIVDGYWNERVPFSQNGLKSSMTWYELLVGVHVHIYKNIHMGWSIRMKRQFSLSDSGYGDPWYVPGFGEYDKSRFGLTYSIIYKLPY